MVRPLALQEQPVTLAIVVAALSLCAVMVGWLIGQAGGGTPSAQAWPPAGALRACIGHRLGAPRAAPAPLADIDAAQISCYTELRNELLLNDFQLRRMKFHEQSRDGHVLLWVVVLITLSGVALSALQLLASYRLAGTGAGAGLDTPGEFSVERGKVSLKSSVTGLFILLFSFAFFALFVAEVYKIKELRVEHPPNAAAQLEAGRLEPAASATDPAR